MDFLEQELLRLTGERNSEGLADVARPDDTDAPNFDMARAGVQVRRQYPTSSPAWISGHNHASGANDNMGGSQPMYPTHPASINDSTSASAYGLPNLPERDTRHEQGETIPQDSSPTWTRPLEGHTVSNRASTLTCNHVIHKKESGWMLDVLGVEQDAAASSANDVSRYASQLSLSCVAG